MRQQADIEKLHKRLSKIIGQIKAIDKMIENEVPCENILVQINATHGALHKTAQIVLEGHLDQCVRDGIEHGDAEKTIAEFAKAIEYFSRMAI
jgi:DNA-binding FrmR family transcriptional regulator